MQADTSPSLGMNTWSESEVASPGWGRFPASVGAQGPKPPPPACGSDPGPLDRDTVPQAGGRPSRGGRCGSAHSFPVFYSGHCSSLEWAGQGEPRVSPRGAPKEWEKRLPNQ